MSSRLKLAGICFAAAFALAACGGGGGTTAVMPPDPTPTEPPAPPAPSGESIALAAREAGDAVAKAATQAIEDATKYSAMLDAVSNKGDSAMAAENAQKVLDARSNLEMAIMDAESAVEAAEEAKMAAEDDEALTASLDAAIMAANAQIKAAKTTLTGNALAMLTRTVTGAPTDTGYPKAASATAKAVAMTIHTALTTSAQLSPGTTRATSTQMAAGNEANNSMGYNWGQLAEMLGLPVSYIRVQRDPPGTPPRPTMSVVVGGVNGQAVPTLQADGTTPVTATDFEDRAGDTAGLSVTMFGLPGTLYCQPGPCTVKNGKLYGGERTAFDSRIGETVTYTPQWRFTPSNPVIDRYIADSANPGSYKVETGYVNYGYWISVDTADPPVTSVNIYAEAAANTNTASLDLAFPSTDNPKEGSTAKYSGSALGVASRQQGIESGTTTYASGEFTADVSLTATFGATATLAGKVYNFRGNVADSRWVANLGATNLDAAANFGGTPGTVTGDTGATAGAWTAQGYGTAAKRPSGFFGTFNANFANGSAAGGYEATRDTE